MLEIVLIVLCCAVLCYLEDDGGTLLVLVSCFMCCSRFFLLLRCSLTSPSCLFYLTTILKLHARAQFAGFAEQSELVIDGFGSPRTYTIDVYKDNKNFRTIKQFSTEAKKLMYDPINPTSGTVDNRPYPTYLKFYDYYKVYAYADNWIHAAFKGVETEFEHGNADFTDYDDMGKLGMFGILR